MRALRWLSVCVFVLLSLTNIPGVAAHPQAVTADPWEQRPGTQVVFYESDQEVQTYIAPPVENQFRAQAATIEVDYTGFSPEAQAAFQYAVGIWQSLLVAPVPIRVQATWETLPQGALGAAGPSDVFRSTTLPQANTWYAVALAQQLAKRDLNPGEPDIVAKFNSNYANWYFGTGATPPNQINFALVVLHELGHGIGFFDSFDVASNQGRWGSDGFPVAYDRFVVNGAGANLIDTAKYPNPSTELAGQLRSNAIFFNGGNARAANGGNPARLFAPATYSSGSSIGHLDEDTYPPGNPNSLMTPLAARGETNYNPGPIALGVLRDLGWTISDLPPQSPPPSASPSPSGTPSPSASPLPVGQCAAGERYFDVTKFCVPPIFASYWDSHGGLAQQGWPVGPAFNETNPTDGKSYLTQYFERARFEYHPENTVTAPAYVVLLGLVGREQSLTKYPSGAPVRAGNCLPGEQFFEQTKHCVSAVFYKYWESNGGLAQQGLPLTDLFEETNPTDGKKYQTQYFERARFEYHPENAISAPAYVVLLGLLGNEQYKAKYPNGPGGPGPSPSPSPSPSGNVIFQDNFTDPNSGWPTGKTTDGAVAAEYVNGAYRIAIAAANYLFFPTNRSAPIANVADVRVEVDVFEFSPPGGTLYGVTCRATDGGNFYLAATDGASGVTIYRVQGNQPTRLVSGTASGIKPGTAGNRLRFDCVGNTLTFYLNGQKVAETQDGAYTAGRIGFFGYSGETGGLDVHYRNLVVSKP